MLCMQLRSSLWVGGGYVDAFLLHISLLPSLIIPDCLFLWWQGRGRSSPRLHDMSFLATACLFETGFSGNPWTPLGACPCLFLEYTGGLEDVGYCLVWDPYAQQVSSDLYILLLQRQNWQQYVFSIGMGLTPRRRMATWIRNWLRDERDHELWGAVFPAAFVVIYGNQGLPERDVDAISFVD